MQATDGRPRTVSDALCLLADKLVGWERGHRVRCDADGGEPSTINAVFARIDDAVRGHGDILDAPIWEYEIDAILGMAPLDRLSWPLHGPETPDDLPTLVVAAMVCDLWHGPIESVLKSTPLPRLESHDDAEDSLAIENRYNDDPSLGFLIPSRIDGRDVLAFETARVGSGILGRYLSRTTYIPAVLDRTHPDADAPSSEGRRGRSFQSIAMSYRRVPETSSTRAVPLDGPIRVSIAPLAEQGYELDLVPSEDRQTYGLALNYPAARIVTAVRDAIDENAHLLVIPEMAIDGRHLPVLQDAIVTSCEAYFEAHGRIASLRYVMAGVLGEAEPGDAEHRNFVVIFDADGTELSRQEKLAHWNLTGTQQQRLGVTYHHDRNGALADPLFENTRPARRLEIIDLPDLGRCMTLICADVSQDDPGDWLMANIGLDWLNFPIMDKSVCWEKAIALGKPPPWIVHRAHRACQASGARVIVSNSVAMTCWASAEAARAGTTDWIFQNCGIGLLLDHSADTIRQDHISTPIVSAARVKTSTWVPETWKTFPSPPY